MWRLLLRLIRLSGSADPVHDQYDPIYGLPRGAVEEWLARNLDINDEYEVELQQRAVRQGLVVHGRLSFTRAIETVFRSKRSEALPSASE